MKIIKLLSDRNGNYWFCPDCAKPAFTAIFIDKDIKEDAKTFLNP